MTVMSGQFEAVIHAARTDGDRRPAAKLAAEINDGRE